MAVGARVDCPRCGHDVMVTGWTETAVQTRSYMRIHGGAALIAQTTAAAALASCLCCGAALKATPAEMQRIA